MPFARLAPDDLRVNAKTSHGSRAHGIIMLNTSLYCRLSPSAVRASESLRVLPTVVRASPLNWAQSTATRGPGTAELLALPLATAHVLNNGFSSSNDIWHRRSNYSLGVVAELFVCPLVTVGCP